jgi:outer membrane lipoprotein-sorting protein
MLHKIQIIFILFSTSILLFSCNEEEEIESTQNISEKKEPVESIAKRFIESKLEISAAEKYKLEIYKSQLDGDNEEDAIVAVNRYNYAVEKAGQSKNPGKVAEIGYMGPYNYIFYYDGATGIMNGPMEIPSTPISPLKISFEKVMSEAYSDVVVSFRIRNSCFKHIYTIQNKKPRLVFGWKLFDGFGTPDAKGVHLVFETTAVSLPKDIRVMKANIISATTEQNYDVDEPVMEKLNEEEYRFIYNPKEGKYAIKASTLKPKTD